MFDNKIIIIIVRCVCCTENAVFVVSPFYSDKFYNQIEIIYLFLSTVNDFTSVSLNITTHRRSSLIVVHVLDFPDPAKRNRGAFGYIGLIIMLGCTIKFGLSLLGLV